LGFYACQQFGKIIYGLIGTLGRELQSSAKVRNLCLNLVIELRNDDCCGGINQHFIIFAQQFIDLQYLDRLVSIITISIKQKRLPCRHILYQFSTKEC